MYMTSETIDAIMSGLKGDFIHSDPLIILKGLTPDIARKKGCDYNHSCWDLLYHIVLWNDIFLTNIKGNVGNWNPHNNWPVESELENDTDFYNLITTFESQINEIRVVAQDST